MLTIKTHEDFETVRRAVEDNGFPTCSRLAKDLWEWSTDSMTNAALSINVFAALGYEPLAGFPLQRIANEA